MAVMGLRLAGRSNGVAKLHGEVSRQMFAGLWPDVPVDEVPIASVTNGVHAPTWVVARDRRAARPLRAARVGRRRRRRLGSASTTSATTSCGGPASRAASGWWPSSATRLRRPTLRRRAVSVSDVAWTDEVLDPKVAHHRLRPPLRHLQAGHLLLSQPERLRGPAAVARPAGAVRVRRQGPPRRRPRQGADPQIVQFAAEPRRAPPLRVPRRLRHRRGPRARTRAPTCG